MYNSIVILVALMLLYPLSAVHVDALTDPTRPAHYRPDEKKQALRLDSILYSDARRVAIINGKVLSEGDSYAGAKLIKVEPHSVLMGRRGKTIKLVLERTNIRQEK